MRSRALGLVAAVAMLAGACAESAGPVEPADALGDGAVTVGSFDFAESVLLAELYSQALEARGIRVVREFDLGPRELVTPALQQGLVELIPEYTGSLLGYFGGVPSPNPGVTRAELESELEARGLLALGSAPAQDQNGFAVAEAFAEADRLVALSDLEGHSGLVLGGPPECQQRSLCQPGLEETYGLEFSSFVPLSGIQTAEGLTRGIVDVALMFTTSPELERYPLVLLLDDRHLQPAEQVTPVVHQGTLEEIGAELAAALDEVSALLTTEELRAMNAAVQLDDRTAADVAAAWLRDHGLAPLEG